MPTDVHNDTGRDHDSKPSRHFYRRFECPLPIETLTEQDLAFVSMSTEGKVASDLMS